MATHEKSLHDIFREQAELARQNFPDVLEKFIVVSTKEPIYVSPAAAEMLTGNVAPVAEALKKHPKIKRIVQSADKFFKRYKRAAAVAQKGKRARVIGVNDRAAGPDTSSRYSRLMYLVGVFNHEMGHHLVKNGFSDGAPDKQHLAECAAQSFGVLRHHQIFGGNTDLLKGLNYSATIVSGVSPTHYMDVIAYAVENLSSEQDLSALSFKETVDLAGEIALKYHFDRATLEKVAAAFRTVDKKLDWWGDIGATKECFRVMMVHKDDHDIYRTGRRYLERSEAKSAIRWSLSGWGAFFGQRSFWISAFAEMEKFERESGIILDLAKAMDAKRAGQKPANLGFKAP